MEHGSYQKGLRGQKPCKVERPSQGRKKDRRTPLTERRTPPRKEREVLRKETGKHLRKPRCAVALLSYSLPVPGRVGFHVGREVVTALAPTSPDQQNSLYTLFC